MEASHRPKQAQHFSTCIKLQSGNSRVHQDFPDSGVVGIVNRSIGRLPSHPHSSTLKEIPKILPQVSGVPVHIPPLRTDHSPPGLHNDCERGKAERSQTSPIPGRLADQIQSQEEAQVNTQAVVDLTQSLGWIINQEKSELKPTRVFSFMGYEYHLDSALVKPTQEKWLKLQDLILRLKSKLDVAKWVANLNREDGPGGTPSHEALQFHLKEHWKFPQSLDNLLPWTETISAHLRLVTNPVNVMKGADLHSKDHSILLFTDASNEGWGSHLKQVLLKTCGQNRTEKKGYT